MLPFKSLHANVYAPRKPGLRILLLHQNQSPSSSNSRRKRSSCKVLRCWRKSKTCRGRRQTGQRLSKQAERGDGLEKPNFISTFNSPPPICCVLHSVPESQVLFSAIQDFQCIPTFNWPRPEKAKFAAFMPRTQNISAYRI